MNLSAGAIDTEIDRLCGAKRCYLGPTTRSALATLLEALAEIGDLGLDVTVIRNQFWALACDTAVRYGLASPTRNGRLKLAPETRERLENDHSTARREVLH